MEVLLIAAIASNGAIGKNNDLMWSLPDDMAFFKRMTLGRHVVMGRRNWESIPHKYRPLPNRSNIVLTRNSDYKATDAHVLQTLDAALNVARAEDAEETYIIGGAQIYAAALAADIVETMWLTHVHKDFEGDTFFPTFEASRWETEIFEEHTADARHEAAFTIVKYTRKKSNTLEVHPKRGSILSSFLILLVRFYQAVLSPLLGANCRHTPSCSSYGIQAMTEWGGLKGGWMTLRRVARCNPWNASSYDPVPTRDLNPDKSNSTL